MASDPTFALAFLPTLPTDTSLNSLQTAYGPGLAEIFRRTVSGEHSSKHKLDIAVLCSEQQLPISNPRGSVYRQLQSVLGHFYSLICSVLAQKPEIDAEGKVDYRVFFVSEQEHGDDEFLLPFQGPIVELRGLALAQRPWSDVFAMEGESGERVLQRLNALRKALPPSRQLGIFNVHRVVGGTNLRLASPLSSAARSPAERSHYSIAVGGTFDHLHAGHKLLLTATAAVLEPWRRSIEGRERVLTVGITGDELLTKKRFADELESWEERQQAVIDFLSALLDISTSSSDKVERQRFAGSTPNANAVHYKFDGNLTVRCVEISDPYGPTITDERISALVVSGETRSGGKAVNDKRVEKGWEALEVFEIDVLDESPTDDPSATATENFQSKISSTAIRERLQQQKSSR